jgi:hypothetical protein
MPKKSTIEGVERVTLKLPKSVAAYFRKTFPHGRRSEFVVECLERFRREAEIKAIEDELEGIGKNRT